ncbi:MAG: flagellar hook-basal body complex protein [Sphingomonadales bacterium]|nr:flagellar hook-basal body complex protein [Sphingomonadales bacterium]
MSFYTSLSGLKNAQTDLDVISHNIANADTAGFKKSTASFADIVSASVLTDPTLTVGIGARVEAIKQQFSLGPIEQTGNALDMAVNGDGFFTVKSAISGLVSYTRAGSFKVDGNGFVVNDSNQRMQVFAANANGTIGSTASASDAVVPLNNGATPPAEYTGMSVGSDGRLTAAYADGSLQVIGYVALSSFASNTGLKQLGSASWSATGLSGPASLGQPNSGTYGALLSGAIERSNVDIAEELVGLISAQRSFQANAKAIDTTTQISQTIINLRTS